MGNYIWSIENIIKSNEDYVIVTYDQLVNNPQQTIDIMQVIVEICDESKVPCEFGVDPECPPPEILQRSECYTAWECPPGSRGEFIEWFEAEIYSDSESFNEGYQEEVIPNVRRK